MISYEIQTGYYRTRKIFATYYLAELGINPDIILTAKSLASGLPPISLTAREEIRESLAIDEIDEIGEIGETYDIIGTYRVKDAMTSIEFVKDSDSKGPYPEVTNTNIKEYMHNGLEV